MINPSRPDFLILSPQFGLMIIEIRSWYPKQIIKITQDGFLIHDGTLQKQQHPIVHAEHFLDLLIQNSKKNPVFSEILNSETGQFVVEISYRNPFTASKLQYFTIKAAPDR